MRKSVKAIGAALALSAAGLMAAAPAPARPWGGRGHYHHYDRGDRAGLAVGAGIIGLALGAAIASQPSRYSYDYGYGYPYGGGYGYYPAPPPRDYYYVPPPRYAPYPMRCDRYGYCY
jgi:hypothetical protein